ncbi:MAG: NAD(P)-dependent oxidoreductase [Candidatus Limnocylindrales bacterium]
MRPHVWIPERTPAAARERLAALAELHVFPAAGSIALDPSPADLLVAAYGADRAFEVAALLPGLRYIQVFAAGVDAVIMRTPPGVTLLDASGVHDAAVAEWVLLAILTSQRRLPDHIDAQRTATWSSVRHEGEDLVGAKVLIVGAGSIGREVEARLVPFGATVVRIARRARPGVRPLSDLARLAAAADIVVILLPLTAATRGIIDARIVAAMRPGALLVNASRGAIVDTAALTAAVLEGRVRAALDVTDPEPLPSGHPLWSAPGALITPHVASDVRREDERAWALVVDQVGRLARGEPPINIVVDGY